MQTTPIDQMRKYNEQFLANNKAVPIQMNLDGFYDYIKEEIIKGDIASLNEAASYYFEAEGKLVRPMLNLLYHQMIGDDRIKEQKIWAGVIEMLHVASLVHDDILDDSLQRRGIPCSHQKFGKKAATFSANYLIGRAGRKIAEINDLRLYKIYSRIMDNLTNGEYLQALKHRDYANQQIALQNYMIKTYYKTAALMANSLEGVGVISQTELDGFNIGLHLGLLLSQLGTLILAN